MRPSRYLPKVGTFDGPGFWAGAYAHQRAGLLRKAGVPEGRIAGLVDGPYAGLPDDVRYAVETSGLRRRDLE